MANNINVKLDNSNGTNKLDVVDNGGQNQVNQNQQPTTITWHLTGELAQASFVPMDAAAPGFHWIGLSQPQQGAFGPATVQSNGNSLSITDNHFNASSNGQWMYILRVNYQGTVISTTASLPSGTVTNPIIINH